jgi:hypothetical protein
MAPSLDTLKRFAHSPTPRALPPEIRAVWLPAAPIAVAMAVALLVVVGTWPLVGKVFPDRLLEDLRLDLGHTEQAAAIVDATPAGPTVVRQEGGVDVELAVHAVRFRFQPGGDGAEVEATSHLLPPIPTPGAQALIEFDPSDPSIARLKNSTRSTTPRIGAFIVVLPAIAVAWLLRVARQRRSLRRLLTSGPLATARVNAVRETAATLGPGRIQADLALSDGTGRTVDHDLVRREGRLLRERAAGGNDLTLLVSPDGDERILILDAFAAPSANPAEEFEDDDEEEP